MPRQLPRRSFLSRAKYKTCEGQNKPPTFTIKLLINREYRSVAWSTRHEKPDATTVSRGTGEGRLEVGDALLSCV